MVDNSQTTRIRIAVAIDSHGDWVAYGSSSSKTDDDIKSGLFLDSLYDGEQYCFVEADIPSFQIPTVEGKVS